MSIEGQGHFSTIYFPGFVCFVLYLAKISGERSGFHVYDSITGAKINEMKKMMSLSFTIICLV